MSLIGKVCEGTGLCWAWVILGVLSHDELRIMNF